MSDDSPRKADDLVRTEPGAYEKHIRSHSGVEAGLPVDQLRPRPILRAEQAQRYHAEEFHNARDNYHTETDRIRGTWQGTLAVTWALAGEVRDEHFQRLAEGRHPISGEQLVRHQTAREITNAHGQTMTTMEHRAGWDATFSAPKSVSITALVGSDASVRQAHRESVHVALRELEPYVQARLGGNRRPETTGRAVMALFEHDSARPVNGYAAPQLHTHVVIFNLTETADGTVRPLQPQELYRTQQYATAVYRSGLAARLTALGYEIERGRSGQPEIRGYSREYLEASSPRRQQIEAYLAEADRAGAGAAQIAAHQTREHKVDVSHDEMQQQHRDLAEQFGNQPAHVLEGAEHHRESVEHEREHVESARQAVTFARDRNLEGEAVVEERAILRDALQRSLGEARVEQKDSNLPFAVLSSSQVNALAVSVFLALNIGIPNPPLSVAMLDDPLQSLDDINLLGLVDLLRRAKDRRQLIVSTHDVRFCSLMARKFRPRSPEGRNRRN